MVANTLQESLSCDIAEIESTEERSGFFGVFTCVLDQLLDRDDVIKPLSKDPQNYNPIILASPIWIGRISSPARTFIKQGGLKGKDVYIVLTYNGRLSEEKEKAVKEEVTSQEIKLLGLFKIITKEKTEDDIKKEARSLLEDNKIPLAKKITSD